MLTDEELREARELCRTPSGYEIERKQGKYILHPETYDIMARRANLCFGLLEHIDQTRGEVYELRRSRSGIVGANNNLAKTLGEYQKRASSMIYVLKQALIKERFWAIWRCGGANSVEETTTRAIQQLSNEIPEIDWE